MANLVRAFGLDGAVHAFLAINLNNGRGSFGDRLMDITMPVEKPIEHSVRFGTMFALEAIAETFYLTYGISNAIDGDYTHLAINVSFKSLARGVAYFLDR